MKKTIKVVIVDNGEEEIINLDRENDPYFEETLGNVLCEVFDVQAVEFSIKGYPSPDTALDVLEN